jgi:transposase
VRIALTSGLSRRQVADDLGVGFSTLKKWVSAYRDTDVISAEDRVLARENERLRREVCILRREGTTDLPYNPLKRQRKKSVKIS